MSDAIVAQGAKLEVAGSAGDPVATVTAAVGNPTIITKASHGLTNGTIGTLSAFAGDDAATMNGEIVIVKYVTDDTFAVDIDTTGMTLTAANGTITPLAWVEVCEVVDGNRDDPGSSEIDVTHLQSVAKEFLMGLEDSGTYTFAVNWLFGDTGQQALLTAKTNQTLKNFRVTYSDTSTMTFSAYVQTFSGPSLAVDDKLSGSVTLRISGAITITPVA